MNQAINTCITGLNNIGQGFWDYAVSIFVQSSVLIILLLIIDFLLRKRVRAVFRYCVWMLVFVKLILPTSFALPTGIGYWLADYLPSATSISELVPDVEQAIPIAVPTQAEVVTLEPAVINETVPAEVKLEPICWQGLVFLGWLAGVLVLSALLIHRAWFVKALVAQSKPAKGRLLDMLNECRSQIGIRKTIELRLSDNMASPAVCGLFKPMILMPTTLLEKLSLEKLKAVLIHELAHIKRRDIWVNVVQTVLQIVYFYNPLLWLANAMVRRVREQAVDEMVLVALGAEADSYSNTLIDIGEMAFWRPNLSLRVIGVVESKSLLKGRIKRMLDRPIPKSAKLGIVGLITVIITGAVLLPMAAAKDKEGDIIDSAEGTALPEGWRLDYDTGILPDGATYWLSDMASNLADLRVVPRPSDPFDVSWKKEKYEFDIRSLQGEGMGNIVLAGETEHAHLTLKPDKYMLRYRRGRGKHPDNFRMNCGEFLVDLSRPGMYELKFTPKLSAAEITGSLGGCYALNFEKVGKGPRVSGFVYQYPGKQYLLDGLAAGTYRLSAVTQNEGDNVFVSQAEVTVKDDDKVTVNIDPPALGNCSLQGEILGKLSKPRRDSSPEFKWFVLIRKPDSPPVTTADVYEALTMDTLYVVRGQNIAKETEDKARYHIEGLAPGKYHVTVIEHDLWSARVIARQQSKPLSLKSKEKAVLDFDLQLGQSQRGEVGVEDSGSKRAQFIAKLSNGVTIELVGVCEHPSAGKQWWQPDGKIMKNNLRPYAFKELRSLRLPSNQQENKILELAVKITDSSNRNVGMICSGANRTFVNCRNNVWGGTVEVGKEPGVKDFKIGVATGAWETLASSESKFGGRRRKTPGIVFTEAYNTQKGYAVVIVTHKKDVQRENWRVVAIDKEGKPHKADLYQTQGIGEFEQNMFHFKRLRSDQIKRFEFQTRPYQWIIFRNVSLKLGIKTDVQVEVRGRPSEEIKVERPDASKSKEEILAKLVNLEQQRNRVQRDLDAVERALQDVRTASGFTDLEERGYRHPVTERLMRLEQERDNCVLEIAQLKANIRNLEKRGATEELKNATDNLAAVLEGKLEALDKMVQKAKVRKRDFDRARVQYKQRASIRDERKLRLDEIKAQIEKLRIMYDEHRTVSNK